MKSYKFQITLSSQSYFILELLCKIKGFKKSTVIALALDELFDKEYSKLTEEEKTALKSE